MQFQLLEDIARPQWLRILAAIKVSRGMSVGELTNELGGSYMGLKQHCDAMVKKGLLETSRRPSGGGRPEKAYRLTARAQALFPAAGNDLALDVLKAVGTLYGGAVPEKLLYNAMQEKTKYYLTRVKGRSVLDRATALAKLRHAEGYLSRIRYDNRTGLCIEEFHHPMEDICKAYPVLLKIEERMIETVVGSKVTLETIRHGTHSLRRYAITTL